MCQRQLSVCLQDLLSTFRMFLGPSINFLSGRKTFRQLLSTFRASAGPPANFLYGKGTVHQLSVRPRDLPSTAVNISCVRKIYLKFSILLPDLPSTSVNFLSIRGTFHLLSVRPQNFHQILSAFHVSVGTSKSSVRLLDLLFLSNFCAFAGPSINCLCRSGTFRQHPSTFRLST